MALQFTNMSNILGWCTQILSLVCLVNGGGFLLLYRPKDISNDCVFSHQLRYDLSFGMGMSDTTTLVFRTLNEIDYECIVEIVTDDVYILIVIRFPNTIETNCAINSDAFTVINRRYCARICDLIGDRDTSSPYFILSNRRRIRFRFLSNSSINSDMNAIMYQVTATTARLRPRKGCNSKNESICSINGTDYCFTSGVVCDGIKNCGVNDWYDERKSDCELPDERIGYAPVIAVIAVILCLMLAASHLMMRYLPPLANSFFIFNANEDNRLCIDTVFRPPEPGPIDTERAKRKSIIPVPSSSSESSENESDSIMLELRKLSVIPSSSPEAEKISEEVIKKPMQRKNTMRTMTEMLSQRLRSVTGRRRNDAQIELDNVL